MHQIIINLLKQINKYYVVPKWKILKCINKKLLKSHKLCANINATSYIKKFIETYYIIKNSISVFNEFDNDLDFMRWDEIAANKNTIKFLKREIKISKTENRNTYLDFRYLIPNMNAGKIIKKLYINNKLNSECIRYIMVNKNKFNFNINANHINDILDDDNDINDNNDINDINDNNDNNDINAIGDITPYYFKNFNKSELYEYLLSDISTYKLLKNNINKINWDYISCNDTSIKLLKRELIKKPGEPNLCKINFDELSANPYAIDIINYEIKLAKLENRNCRINYDSLLFNENAIEHIKNYIKDKPLDDDIVRCLLLNSNPGILNIKKDINYDRWILNHGTKKDIIQLINKNEILYNYSMLSNNKNIFEVDKLNYKNNLLILSNII